jgi:UDP-N-acetylglucosamine 2-epimerase
MVVADGSGIQQETTVVGVPCLTMRPSPERAIACETGANVLVGTGPKRILNEADAILDGRTRSAAIPASGTAMQRNGLWRCCQIRQWRRRVFAERA